MKRKFGSKASFMVIFLLGFSIIIGPSSRNVSSNQPSELIESNLDGISVNPSLTPDSHEKPLQNTIWNSLTRENVVKHFAKYNLHFEGAISPYFSQVIDKDLRLFADGSSEFILGVQSINVDLKLKLEGFGISISAEIPQINALTVLGHHDSINEFLLEFGDHFNLNYIEPNSRISLLDTLTADGIPTDPLYVDQWGHDRVDAPEAWNIISNFSRGEDVLVAVIDTGVDYTHPDLDSVYVPLGYDWVFDDNDPMDDHDHGTHVAGIVAAEINNSIGIAGVAPVKIMAEKFLDSFGFGDLDDGALAIIHATDAGADILSNSWGAPFEVQSVSDAIDYASSKGAVFVASAGNGFGPDADIRFPGAHPEAISVSSIDESNLLSFFSSYGHTIDVAAPGGRVLSTTIGGNYEFFDGTSMAAPHVSAIAALMLMEQPDLTPTEIRAILHETSQDLGDPGFDIKYGYGSANAFNAVSEAARDPIDLRASIFVPQKKLSVNDVSIFKFGIFNFGATSVTDVNVTVYRNGVEYQNFIYPSMAGASFVLEEEPFISTLPVSFNLTLQIDGVAGEIDLTNNIDHEFVDLGSQTYSVQSRQFEWVDASITGTDMGLLGDDNSVSVDLPFFFNFYNASFKKVFVSTNGWMSFVDVFPTNFIPPPLPNDFDAYTIAPLWSDLYFPGEDEFNNQSRLWVRSQSDHIIIQYTDVMYLSGNAAGTFQAVLYKNGDIVFNYLDTTVQFATIGVNHGVRSNDATEILTDDFDHFRNSSFILSQTIGLSEADVGIRSIRPTTATLPNESISYEFVVLNFGTNQATDISVDLSIDGSSVFNQVTTIPSGTGEVFNYIWTPTIEGVYEFNFTVSSVVNETNLINNFETLIVTVAQTRLSVSFDTPIELRSVFEFERDLIFGYMVQETSNPRIASLVIYTLDRISNETLEAFTINFDVLTFLDLQGFPIGLIIPNDAGLGYQDPFGEIEDQISYSYQGTLRDVWEYRSSGFGQTIYYDTTQFIAIALGFYDDDTEETQIEIDLEFSELISGATHNQMVYVRGNSGNIGSQSSIDIYVRNTGTSDEAGSSVLLSIDGNVVETVTVPAITSGASFTTQIQVQIDEGFHSVRADLQAVSGETYTEDNLSFSEYSATISYAVFQDFFPFGSDAISFLLEYAHGIQVQYFDSNDIGLVDLSGFPRVIVASGQPEEFINKVEANLEWFENYVENGGRLQFHAASDGSTYQSLPGGLGIVDNENTFTDFIQIVDREVAVFNNPNFISDNDLDHWGYSAHGYLTDVDPQNLILAEWEFETDRPVMVAKPIGSGEIIYTVQPLEAWWANWNLLENLLIYEPIFPSFPGPSIDGMGSIDIALGSGEELFWVLTSDNPKEYTLTVDGVLEQSSNWFENHFIVKFDASSLTVGTHHLQLVALDIFDKSSVFTTTLNVFIPQEAETSSSSTTGGGGGDDGFIAVSTFAILASLAMIATYSLLRRRSYLK